MITGIAKERVAAMTPIERRWLDNIKKAFYDSDTDVDTMRMEDNCIETLFKGIDAAKTLRLSLLDEANLRSQNRSRFISFLELKIPSPSNGARRFSLIDVRTAQEKEWSVAEIMYEIRCMIHENENLNAAEPVDYHILLDWCCHGDRFVSTHENGRMEINARVLWRRLREILSTFITVIEALESMANNQGFTATCTPDMGSIQPQHRQR
jgi:hypothetical protein